MEEMTKAEFQRFASHWFPESTLWLPASHRPRLEDLPGFIRKKDIEALRAVQEPQFAEINFWYSRSRDYLHVQLMRSVPFETNQEELEAEVVRARKEDVSFQQWALKALRTKVEMRLGKLAVIQAPKEAFWVEIEWEWIRKEKTHRVRAVHLFPEDEVLPRMPHGDLTDHLAAFFIHNAVRNFKVRRTPQKPPEAGKPFHTGWYRDLLDDYKELLDKGHPAPAKELARRRRITHSTMKSYLHRARKHLEKEG